eukprot:3473096-Pleurochrysis_carterae.AAC.1
MCSCPDFTSVRAKLLRSRLRISPSAGGVPAAAEWRWLHCESLRRCSASRSERVSARGATAVARELAHAHEPAVQNRSKEARDD